MNLGKHLAPVLLLAMLSGCVTYPIAKNLQKQAQPLTLTQVKANPEGTRGAIVIWGGRIINTVNDTNGGAIYVLKLLLKGNGKPQVDIHSTGRFVATSPDFLDPEDYPNGRLVTIAGLLNGVETEPLQHMQYTYPELIIKQVHVWPPRPKEYYYYGPGWYWDDYPGWWWGGPGWYYPGDYGGFYRGGFRGGGGFHGGGADGHH